MQKDKELSTLIINTAQELFSKFGYKKTTMDDIAKAIHKGKSTLYYYFKNKEEVFASVVEKESRNLISELRMAVNACPMSKDKLEAYFIKRITTIHDRANHYNVMVDEVFQDFNLLCTVREKYLDEEKKIVMDIFEEGMENGEFITINSELTAESVMLAIKGFELSWAKEEDYEALKHSVDNILSIVFHGLLSK